jgi:hypothetical protein
MKTLASRLLFSILLLMGQLALAQSGFTISGKVTDENQKPVHGATIFIDGTQLVTLTNDEGKFEITISRSGSYRVLVKMIGYNAISKDVGIIDKPVQINFNLSVKSVMLHSVNVGGDKAWASNYAIFKKEFLGSTDNANSCEITNSQIIYFSTSQNMLYANADDFLIIENKRLGYQVKYLLKTFQHSTTANTAYNGDVVFEEMQGTDQQKKEWAKNRLETYKGSMMHFLRSVFTNSTLQEGFISNEIYDGGGKSYYAPKLAKFEDMITAVDTSFVYFNFKGLRILYDTVKTARYLKSNKLSDLGLGGNKDDMVAVKSSDKESQLIRYLNNPAVLDSRGAVSSSYLLSFLIRGAWTYKRVGDQLPFEYQPPVSAPPAQ